MAIIDPEHLALAGDSMQFWRDELANEKIHLYELEKAILYLTTNRIGRYMIDTGQNSQTVQYQDMNSLRLDREATIKLIYQIETYLGINGSQINQVVPRW
jgi:hypothetical protein